MHDCLYSIRAVRLASMMCPISVDLASNQSRVFEVFFPKRSEDCAVHGVSDNFPLLCGRVFGLILVQEMCTVEC